MSLSLLNKLGARAEARNPLRVGLIGAGKFGTMYLSQAHRVPGLHVAGIADISLDRIREAQSRAEWPRELAEAPTLEQALKTGAAWHTEDGDALIRADDIEVIVEATGNPIAGTQHALGAIENGKHVIMVNVEADVLVGPALVQKAQEGGVVYSLAYGDQPALICELVDWARMSGFEVVCAGKGNKFMPEYNVSTPDTVWEYYGYPPEKAVQGGMNPKLFNSFLDGTKAAIEMAAVANATGLKPQSNGLAFPPGGIHEIADICRPKHDGGVLSHAGTVEIVSSMHRDGRPVENDLRWGVFITIKAPGDYVRRCFSEYGVETDSSGWYASVYRTIHFVGLELNKSVLKAGLHHEATGYPAGFEADVISVAKRDLSVGETLDGEGGYCVYGALRPAADAVRDDHLPIGLAQGVMLKCAIGSNQPVRWSDVEIDERHPVVNLRREMETRYCQGS